MSSLNNLESAQELLEHNISNESNNITIDNILCYIKKSKIKNTDSCTQKWLEQELCEFFADMKCQNRKPYKLESIISAYTSLSCYIFEVSAIKNVNINNRFQFPILYCIVNRKIMELQDQGLGLTAEEIRQILLYLESEINNGSWFDKDRLGKNTLSNMMKEIACISDINITDQRITNHLGRRTAIQLLLDLNVNKHKMMQFLGYRSTDGLCTYKIPNNEQRLKNSTLLLNALQEFPIVQQKESEQEESQVMQQDESQVMQQEESQVMQQEESQIMWQEKFQVIQPNESQATQYEESQVMQHDVQITQHKEFQTTQQVIQNNSLVMQYKFNSTATQVSHQIIYKKKTKAYTQKNSNEIEQAILNSIQKYSRPNPTY
ncbi:40726_t:CDS:2 [Gigaspora margarita]|uniref:40726_t:CDS:1 n=1 Tax=Gigaspora margarita TaxID=4874 RepID=A0ABN7VNA9_GIGMA|nr:40726_t:CDS:2 [Gigaspora margarita]